MMCRTAALAKSSFLASFMLPEVSMRKANEAGAQVVLLERVEIDADALGAKLEVLLLEPLDEPPLLVQDDDGHENVLRPGALGVR